MIRGPSDSQARPAYCAKDGIPSAVALPGRISNLGTTNRKDEKDDEDRGQSESCSAGSAGCLPGDSSVPDARGAGRSTWRRRAALGVYNARAAAIASSVCAPGASSTAAVAPRRLHACPSSAGIWPPRLFGSPARLQWISILGAPQPSGRGTFAAVDVPAPEHACRPAGAAASPGARL